MNRSLNLRHRKPWNSFCSLLFGLLSVLIFVPWLEAAIVPTGNVEPVGTWTTSTTGYVGNTSDGSLLVDAGSVLQSSRAYIAYNNGVSGTVTILGTNSQWANSDYLDIGVNGGTGTLRIEAGGQVSNSTGSLGRYSGSSGTAIVTGPGSTWTNNGTLSVGTGGNGTLRIEAGGQVTSSYSEIGINVGSIGTATVTGAGSTWTNDSRIFIGMGTLTVADGGEVITQTLYASAGNLCGNGTITVNQGGYLDVDLCFNAAHSSQGTASFGSGGTLTLSATGGGELAIGYRGNGSLAVADGVAVSSSWGYLGKSAGSSGTATITGAGSRWISNEALYVGFSGAGALRIEAGGQVTSSNGYLSYGSGTSTVTVTGAGSKWTNSYELYVGRGGDGTLTVADGGEVTAQMLYASLNKLYGNGSITATKGAVLDADFRFDAAHPSQTSIAFGSGGTLTVTAAGGSLGAGYKGNGSLTVAEGVTVNSSGGVFGYSSGSSGTATITGTGSKWAISSNVRVGHFGIGSLHIEAGGQVNSSSGALGVVSGSSGTVTVTGTGSKWTNNGFLYIGDNGSGTLTVADGGEVITQTLYASVENLLGNGIITVTKNVCLDADIRFNAAQPAQGTVSFGSGGTLIFNAAGGGELGIGYKKNGSLIIAEGASVTSSFGILGSRSGSSGTATVTGIGSTWTNNGLHIGRSGVGTLLIAAGGQVSNTFSVIGYTTGSSGTVTVTGDGSKWINSSSLVVGGDGAGALHLRDGGIVTASSLGVKSNSLITLDTAYGSTLTIVGGLNHYGKIRVLTGPHSVAGSQYSPIVANTWTSTGTYQALGGTWNASSHVFTVSQTLSGVSGTPIAVDLTQRQRVLVNDNTNGWTVGASLLAKTGTGNTFNFTATAVEGTDLTLLNNLLEPRQSLLSGWNFAAMGSGHNANDPIYLSLGIPASLNHGNLQLWRQSGGTWSRFAADDLTAVDGYASFTITGLSGYAIAGFLPLPAWKADADGLWQNGANWTTEPSAPGGVNTAAVFGPAITAPRTVTLGESLTLGVLTFDSAQHYTLAGAESLKLEVNPTYTAEIDVKQSDAHGHVIETPITVASPLKITLATSSSLTLSGEIQNPTGQTITLVGGGTLTVTQGLVTTGAIHVQAGTLVTTSLTADTLTIGGGASSTLSSVPEPSSLFILLAAMVALAGRFLLARRNSQAE